MNKIGKYRTIPKNTKVWSISLQENVYFDKDIVVKITNKTYGEKDYVFETIQLELFKNMIPTCIDKANGEVSFNYDNTKDFSFDLPF